MLSHLQMLLQSVCGADRWMGVNYVLNLVSSSLASTAYTQPPPLPVSVTQCLPWPLSIILKLGAGPHWGKKLMWGPRSRAYSFQFQYFEVDKKACSHLKCYILCLTTTAGFCSGQFKDQAVNMSMYRYIY